MLIFFFEDFQLITYQLPNKFASVTPVIEYISLEDILSIQLRTESTKSPILPLRNKKIDAKLKCDCASAVTIIIFYA